MAPFFWPDGVLVVSPSVDGVSWAKIVEVKS